jgi:hypothetical protein
MNTADPDDDFIPALKTEGRFPPKPSPKQGTIVVEFKEYVSGPQVIFDFRGLESAAPPEFRSAERLMPMVFKEGGVLCIKPDPRGWKVYRWSIRVLPNSLRAGKNAVLGWLKSYPDFRCVIRQRDYYFEDGRLYVAMDWSPTGEPK